MPINTLIKILDGGYDPVAAIIEYEAARNLEKPKWYKSLEH